MPGRTSSETNIVDPENSTKVLLPGFGNFTGKYVEVSAYSSITLTIKSDVSSAFGGIQVQWSTDGITSDLQPQRFTLDPGNVGQGETFHATTRGQFYRISYDNSFSDQTSFVLTAILRKGAAQGTVRSIDPTNTFTPDVDAQVAWALLSSVGRFNTQQMFLLKADDVDVISSGGPYLFTSPRPGRNNILRRQVPASTSPVLVTGLFGPNERAAYISVTNDSLRGIMYLGLGNPAVSPTTYDFKIPPQHRENVPSNAGLFTGAIYAVWDVDDGTAYFSENYYG